LRSKKIFIQSIINSIVNRGNPKRCPECDRKLLKFKTERYDASNDTHIPYIFGRVCLPCKILYQNEEFENFKILVSEIGS